MPFEGCPLPTVPPWGSAEATYIASPSALHSHSFSIRVEKQGANDPSYTWQN